MQMTQLRSEAELKKKRDEAWAAARRAKPAETGDEDSDLPFIERWKKPLIGVAAVLLLAVIGYCGREYWRTHRKVDAPLDAEEVWQDYCNDPAAANKKYANHHFSIVGRIVIEPTGGGRPARVYFQAPDEKRLRIQCKFTDWGEFADTSNRSSNYHLISGEFKPYEAGPVIELSNCIYVGGANAPVSALSAALNPLARRKEPGVRNQEPGVQRQLFALISGF